MNKPEPGLVKLQVILTNRVIICRMTWELLFIYFSGHGIVVWIDERHCTTAEVSDLIKNEIGRAHV